MAKIILVCFNTNMNISKINNQQSKTSFGARPKDKKVSSLDTEPFNELRKDTVEINSIEIKPKIPKILPDKFELTDAELAYDGVWRELKRLEMDILTQKANLKDFYSAQDRLEYKELLKQRQNTLSKLKRIAHNCGLPEMLLKIDITIKKEYNRYAPKILRSSTSAELKQAQETIDKANLCTQTLTLLDRLLKQHKKAIKKI